MIREKQHIVVATVCAPFKENGRNPTQDVNVAIPDCIQRQGRLPITIIKFPRDFRNVITDMDIIAGLWSGKKQVYDPDSEERKKIHIDAILHLGMNFADYWQVEKRARRDGYDCIGDDGVPLPKHNGDPGGRWEGLPEDLTPIFDVDDVVRRLHEDLPEIPTRTSTDAGLLYCEFIFYTSLATLYKQNEPARVLFMHHAGKRLEKEDIEAGTKVAVSAICSMVDQLDNFQIQA